MSALYELTTAYKDFQENFDSYVEAVESGDIPEDAIWDSLQAIDEPFEDKIDSMACISKQMRYEAAMLDAEAKKLQARSKVKKASADHIEDYISASMQAVGKKKIETARNRISFRKSEKVKIDDEDYFVQWAQEYNPDLLSYKTPEPNKTVIKKILASGQAIEGCRVEQCMNLQIK